MRILLGIRSLTAQGGAENQFVLLAQELQRAGHDVVCLIEDPSSDGGDNQYHRRLVQMHIPIYEHKLSEVAIRKQHAFAQKMTQFVHYCMLPYWLAHACLTRRGPFRTRWHETAPYRNRFFRTVRSYLQFRHRRRLMRRVWHEFHPEIFHFLGLTDWAGAFRFFGSRCQVVYSLCTAISPITVPWVGFLYDALPWIDGVTAECEGAVEDFRTHFSFQKSLRPIPALTEQPEIQPYAVVPGPVRFCYVAKLAHITKNLKLLLQALHIVVANRNDIHFDIVGEGPDTPMIVEALSKLRTQVVLHGLLTQTEVFRIIQDGDGVLLTSFVEGMPNVIVEAMSLGKPVIATAVGCIPEMIEGNGILIPSNDVTALVEAILKLADDAELRAQMGRKSRTLWEQRYMPETILEQYVRFYSDLRGTQ